MLERAWVAVGAVVAGLGVAAGAFATHGLRGSLDDVAVTTFETGAGYQVYHGIALVLAGLASGRLAGRWAGAAGWCFLVGVAVFSGGLYLLALSDLRWPAAIVPLGGAAFLLGWGLLAIAALRGRS